MKPRASEAPVWKRIDVGGEFEAVWQNSLTQSSRRVSSWKHRSRSRHPGYEQRWRGWWGTRGLARGPGKPDVVSASKRTTEIEF